MATQSKNLARADALAGAGHFEQAGDAYRALLKQQPDNAAAHRGLGMVYAQSGDVRAALPHLETCLKLAPDDAELQFTLGNIHLAAEEPARAIEHYQSAAILDSRVPEIFNNLGTALHQADREVEALAALEMALSLRPDFAEAHNTLGNVHASRGDAEAAARHFERALAAKPDLLGARINLGHALRDLGRPQEAKTAFEKAAASDEGFAAAHNGLGLLLQADNQHAEARSFFERAIAADPASFEARNNLAISYQALGRHADALSVCRDIVAACPGVADVQFNLGHILQALGRHEEAAAAYETALRIDPALDEAAPFLAHSLLYICRWDSLADIETRMFRAAEAGTVVVPPFALAGTAASPALRLVVARRSAAQHAKDVAAFKSSLQLRDPPPQGKIRVGYVSPDFRGHSVAIAFRGLFEARDRTGFEWFGYSLNSPRDDTTTASFETEFDSFTDVGGLPAREAAQRINADGIHVLVDLAGHTRDSRLEIFALQPAPVQAHYLGYGSTIGADYIPWLITDPVHTPPELAPHCSEALVYLPDTFMAATPSAVSEAPVTRRDCGLPDDGVVFANFNAHYKFRPEIFDVWMRLLRGVPGSVLWLRDGMPGALGNLRAEAERRKVDPVRLVFAPRAEHDAHLARHRLADLSLDTQRHTGGVTTTDSLWAGVPVVTIAGTAHSERTGTSLLHAIGLEELVSGDLESYFALARDLALDGEKLRALRARLETNRLGTPLFDVQRLARHLETAYSLMVENRRDGKAPQTIHVPRAV